MGSRPPAQRPRERVCEGDGIAFDRDVDVEALLSEEDVADGSADEVDTGGVLAQGGDGLDDLAEPSRLLQLLRDRRNRLRRLRDGAFEGSQEIGPAHDSDELLVAEHRDAAVLRGGDERTKLLQRRVLPALTT